MDRNTLADKFILITAGPTIEAIDPVRFISNHSTGKMGYAIAEAFFKRGARVVIVSGPVSVATKHTGIEVIKINSALEMHSACSRYYDDADIVVFAAAVADYRPQAIEKKKIKKSDDSFMLKMVKNIDIALEFGKIKKERQLSIGFALETNNELDYAIEKLNKKNFDMVVLNSMKDDNATFGYDTNKIKIIKRDYSIKDYSLKSKIEVAEDIADSINEQIKSMAWSG